MRILVIDANVRYMNPMRNALPFYLSMLGDVFFYGPGYCSSDIIMQGIENYVHNNGPFDVVIRTIQSVQSRNRLVHEISYKNSIGYYKRSFNFEFDDLDLKKFWDEVPRIDSLSISSCNVILLHQWDWQIAEENFCEYLIDEYDLIVGLNKDFVIDISRYSKDHFVGYGNITTNWFNLVHAYEEKVIGLPNFVVTEEFDFNSLDSRKHLWSILGAPYSSRMKAKTALKENSIDLSDGKSAYSTYVKIMNKIGFNMYSDRRNMDIINRDFFNAMRGSKYNYTCGSLLKMPIRKFFEIPASGSLLVCDPCMGFEKLGFIDNENCIVCDPNALPSLTEELENSADCTQTIATAGRQLVKEKHTLNVRSQQLLKAIKLVVNKKYCGSEWFKGDLVFRVPDRGSVNPTPLGDGSVS